MELEPLRLKDFVNLEIALARRSELVELVSQARKLEPENERTLHVQLSHLSDFIKQCQTFERHMKKLSEVDVKTR